MRLFIETSKEKEIIISELDKKKDFFIDTSNISIKKRKDLLVFLSELFEEKIIYSILHEPYYIRRIDTETMLGIYIVRPDSIVNNRLKKSVRIQVIRDYGELSYIESFIRSHRYKYIVMQ